MKRLLTISLLFIFSASQAQKTSSFPSTYISNRAPLRANPFIDLPLGAIKADGWLKEMLLRQKNGATGNLDSLYPLVMSKRNGWQGGDGDQWERGPYWIDGLLPLAYILNDKTLIAKVRPWIEWTLSSQQPDGYFGPSKDYSPEPGIQRDNSHDWWPKIVMLKVLQQYYMATADKRVIPFLTNYFRYQLKELPSKPLDHWTFWARYRAGDNLMVVYWLYNITGDPFLLDLADLMHRQTFDFTDAFLHTKLLSTPSSVHGVNLAEGMKEPIIYYQHHADKQYRDATTKGYQDLKLYNGMVHGLYGGDEALHGNNPTQGSELCTAVEMMFTLENTLKITGTVDYADHLERIAFNALPTQIAEDGINRQYFQQANQVMITRKTRNFDTNHAGTDVCYGLLTGYACCTSNMHQGWPKFTQNLWYVTPDSGIAAIVYAPSEVKAFVANGKEVSFKEETNYPFDEKIRFIYQTKKTYSFPFSLRIPEWCKQAVIAINGTAWKKADSNQIVRISREWKSGDVVELRLPMEIRRNSWYENSVSVERGPLAYALKIEGKNRLVTHVPDSIDYGSSYTETVPVTPWNYALIPEAKTEYKVNFNNPATVYPWNLQDAPVVITVRAKRIPSWTLYNDMTGPMPYTSGYGLETGKEEEITLVPYGCTILRVAQFPVLPE
jgi:Beta-L-arabinofuranosidase, GH127